MSEFEAVSCTHGDVTMQGTLLHPPGPGPAPTVMMFPGATGPGDSFRAAMRELAAIGYRVVGIDMYGRDADLSTPQTAGQYFAALMAQPEYLRDRVLAWFEAVRDLPGTTPERIAAVGYCFGGKCVLELARSGAPLAAAISFHGLLTTHAPARPGEVRAEIAVWTGGRDPYAPVADLDALRAELDSAGARYQCTLFSQVRHSFMDPDHDGIAEGIAYDPGAHRIAWAGTLALLAHSMGD